MHYRKLAGAEGAATNPQTTRAYRASQWRRSQVCTYFFKSVKRDLIYSPKRPTILGTPESGAGARQWRRSQVLTSPALWYSNDSRSRQQVYFGYILGLFWLYIRSLLTLLHSSGMNMFEFIHVEYFNVSTVEVFVYILQYDLYIYTYYILCIVIQI